MIRRLRNFALAAMAASAALGITGCMVGPDYERPQTPLPAKYPDEPPAGVAAAPAPIRNDWWTLYDDATLNLLVAGALTDNLDVAFAVARVEEADAQLREASASLFPEVDLGAAGARSRSSGTVTTPAPIQLSTDFRVALSTSFEIDFWGRLRRMVESARAQALSTHYAKDVVTLSLAASLDPALHLAAGRALASLRDEGVLIVASGMSFHNLRGYFQPETRERARAFDAWLTRAAESSSPERTALLTDWRKAPFAVFSHPREEHLIPLMVAAGAASDAPGRRIFGDEPMDAALSAYRFD